MKAVGQDGAAWKYRGAFKPLGMANQFCGERVPIGKRIDTGAEEEQTWLVLSVAGAAFRVKLASAASDLTSAETPQ